MEQDLADIKMTRERKTSDLMTACGMFFAFSDEQFEENKTPLNEGEKYLRLFGGAFMPESKHNKWKEESKKIWDWYDQTINESGLRKQNILYELNNHEAFYIHDIESTMEALGNGYTNEEVWKVFYEELQKQEA